MKNSRKKTLLDDKNRSDEPEMPFFRVSAYQQNTCAGVPVLCLWHEGVLVVLYFGGAFWGEDYGDDVESEGAVGYVVGGEEVPGGSDQFDFFGIVDGLFGRGEGFVGASSDLDEYDGRVGINHNEVDFAGGAGKVAGESFEALAFEELFGAFFAPSAERCSVGEQPASFEQHIVARGS